MLPPPYLTPNPVDTFRTPEDRPQSGLQHQHIHGPCLTGPTPSHVHLLLQMGINHNRRLFEPALQPYARACEMDAWKQLERLAAKEVARLRDVDRQQSRPFRSIPTDVLSVILDFFTIRELSPICQVSREWKKDFDAVMPHESRPSDQRLWRMTWSDIAQYPQLKSPLARHIHGINLAWKQRRRIDESDEVAVTPTNCLLFHEAVSVITTDLPHLHSLELVYRINLPPLPSLSRHLRSLCLTLTGPSDESLASIEETKGRDMLAWLRLDQCHSLETFFLRFGQDDSDGIPSDGIVLPLLQHWRNLTYLRMNLPSLSAESAAAIRGLPHLRTLNGGSQCQWSADTLELLTALPCPFVELATLLPFDEYNMLYSTMSPRTKCLLAELTESIAVPLARLKALPRLLPLSFSANPMTILPGLANLTDLQLLATSEVDIHHCVQALTLCTSLTRLRLKHSELLDAHLTQMMMTGRMDRLSELTLLDCYSLTGISFLSQVASLAKTLTHLEITAAEILPTHITHIAALTSIRSITFDHAFLEQPASELYSRFNPRDEVNFDKELLPHLQSFTLDDINRVLLGDERRRADAATAGRHVPHQSLQAIRQVREFLNEECGWNHRVVFTRNATDAAPFQKCPAHCQLARWQSVERVMASEVTRWQTIVSKKEELEMVRPWQQGRRDVLSRLVLYLGFRELMAIDMLCRSWHVSLGDAPVRSVAYDSSNWRTLSDDHLTVPVEDFVGGHMERSNLARHVRSLDLTWPMTQGEEGKEEEEEMVEQEQAQVSVATSFTLDRLSELYNEALGSIRHHMHHLHHLTLRYPIRLGQRIVPLPTTLRDLHLTLALYEVRDDRFRIPAVDLVHAMLQSLEVEECTALCDFSLEFENSSGHSIDAPDGHHMVVFSFFRHWPTLTSLSMDFPDWDDTVFVALRSLPHLRSLCAYNGRHEPWGTAAIERLTRSPNPFEQLEFLDLTDVTLTTEIGTLLTERIPTLQSLCPQMFALNPSELLPQLLELRELRLFVMIDSLYTVAECIGGLRYCAKLEVLTLKHPNLVGGDMHEIASAMPLLRELSLVDCHSLGSLAFLASSTHLRTHLTTFALESSEITRDQLDFILTLGSIQSIRLQFTVEDFQPRDKNDFAHKVEAAFPQCELSIDV